jgi:hypothetical protein
MYRLLLPLPPLSVRISFSLTRHKRVAEMEKVHNSVAEELQKRYECPGCGTNNMAGVEESGPTSSN